jgi:hypothetical protein
VCQMKVEELKALTASVKEIAKDNAIITSSLKTTSNETIATKQLWKSETKPFLIRAGITLVLLPDPATTVIGTFMLAAGTVQQGVKSRAIYVDDLPKAFQSVMKELRATKELL